MKFSQSYCQLLSLLILALLTPLTSPAFNNKVTCKEVGGTWELINSAGQSVSGSYGFDASSGCQAAVQGQNGNLICSWNGYKFQTYNVQTRVAIGGPEAHQWESLSECNAAIHDQTPDGSFACSWDGVTYRPYIRSTGRTFGSENVWDSQNECVKFMENRSVGDLICGWNGGAFVYNTQGKAVSPQFKTVNDCNALLSGIRNNVKSNQIAKTLSGHVSQAATDMSAFKNGLPNKKVGFAWKKCEVAQDSYHLTKSQNGYIVPECAPDTLYSWGSFEKVQWYQNHLKNGENWSGPLERGLFTVSSPASTFGYGQIPIRVKLRKGVKIKYFRNQYASTCSDYLSKGLVAQAEFADTVFARFGVIDQQQNETLLEYLICSGDVIDSWSVATPEHFDEILRDDQWKRTEHYYNWEGYVKLNGVDQYYDFNVDQNGYGTDFSQAAFKSRMAYLKQLIRAGYGGVYSRDKNQSPDLHFKTDHPIYFNPD